jgi:hypothetical protein
MKKLGGGEQHNIPLSIYLHFAMIYQMHAVSTNEYQYTCTLTIIIGAKLYVYHRLKKSIILNLG